MLPRHLELIVLSYVTETHKILLVGNSRTGKTTLVRRCCKDVPPALLKTLKSDKFSITVVLPFSLTCNSIIFKELGGHGKYRPHYMADLVNATQVYVVVKNSTYVETLYSDVVWFLKRYKSLNKPFTIVLNMRSVDDTITDTDNATLSLFEKSGVRHIIIPSLDDSARPADIRRLLHVST